MTHHHLKASGATCHWGFFDATLRPKLTVKSGDTVTVDTVTGAPDVHPRPEAGFSTPPEMADVHANAEKTLPGHILTGPIAIEGAQPGDVLEVRIEDVQLRQHIGATTSFARSREPCRAISTSSAFLHIPLDLKAKTGRLPWGIRPRTRAVVRCDGDGPASVLGPCHVDRAAGFRRQHR